MKKIREFFDNKLNDRMRFYSRDFTDKNRRLKNIQTMKNAEIAMEFRKIKLFELIIFIYLLIHSSELFPKKANGKKVY